MKLIHTSDWHLGRTLIRKDRYDEHEAFLEWLLGQIRALGAEVLLVSGDIFDSTTPTHRAQQIYYRFLFEVSRTGCRHVVVTGGNHDSPSLLNAPRELLSHLNVHVVGCATDTPADEVLTLDDPAGEPALLVCAVPYLRDRDLRRAESFETPEAKREKLRQGIADHYLAVAEVAKQRRAAMARAVPVVAMGHLFTNGGRIIEGDGVRELYVGHLAHIDESVFDPVFDYVALGHLHVPQTVGGVDTCRYSGSPIPMGFGEAEQQKEILFVTFDGGVQVRPVPVPCFRRLVSVRGDLAPVLETLEALSAEAGEAWLEVVYDGDAAVTDLQTRVDEALEGTGIEALRIRNRPLVSRALELTSRERLDELSEEDVFVRCLDANAVPEAERAELLDAFREVVTALAEEDRSAG